MLDELPLRLVRFLRGVSSSPEIARALEARGYGNADHEAAWNLLVRSFPYVKPSADPPHDDAHQRAAAWYRDHARVVRAALERRFPHVVGRLFRDVSPTKSDDMNATVLLMALTSLPATLKDRRAILDLLGKRGVALADCNAVLRAMKHAIPDAKVRPPPATALRGELVELHAFFTEWSSIARGVIRRRDLLVRLGLAERQRRPTAPAP